MIGMPVRRSITSAIRFSRLQPDDRDVSRSVNKRLDQTLVEVLTERAMHDRSWMNDVPEHKRTGDVKRWNVGARRRIDEKTRRHEESRRQWRARRKQEVESGDHEVHSRRKPAGQLEQVDLNEIEFWQPRGELVKSVLQQSVVKHTQLARRCRIGNISGNQTQVRQVEHYHITAPISYSVATASLMLPTDSVGGSGFRASLRDSRSTIS